MYIIMNWTFRIIIGKVDVLGFFCVCVLLGFEPFVKKNKVKDYLLDQDLKHIISVLSLIYCM